MDRQAGLRVPRAAARRRGQQGLRSAPEDAPGQRLLWEQRGACALCAARIDAGSCEADHVVPVHQSFFGQRQPLQALCLECHRAKTFLECSRHEPGEPVLPPRLRELRLLPAAASSRVRPVEMQP